MPVRVAPSARRAVNCRNGTDFYPVWPALIAITDKSRNAVLALVELARRPEGPVPIQDVADGRGIALHVLEQLFASLRRAGILQSQRGVKGGYSFRRPPSAVSLLEVVEAVDGALGLGGAQDPTAADEVWDAARAGVAEVLGEVTVADILEREDRAAAAPMFHI